MRKALLLTAFVALFAWTAWAADAARQLDAAAQVIQNQSILDGQVQAPASAQQFISALPSAQK